MKYKSVTGPLRVATVAAIALHAMAWPVAAACVVGQSDLDASGEVTITDVQCSILAVLAVLSDAPAPPPCMSASFAALDVDCSGQATVADIVVTIVFALGSSLQASADVNGDGCHDACEAGEPGVGPWAASCPDIACPPGVPLLDVSGDGCADACSCGTVVCGPGVAGLDTSGNGCADTCDAPSCFSSGGCAPEEYCFRATCNTFQGHCAQRPLACTAATDEVCSCTGEAFPSSCHAAAAGHNVGPQDSCCPTPTCGPEMVTVGFNSQGCPGQCLCPLVFSCPPGQSLLDIDGGGCPDLCENLTCDSSADCAPGKYCKRDGCDVLGAPGDCVPMPESCSATPAPVCACNGTSHLNACAAASTGQNVAQAGECSTECTPGSGAPEAAATAPAPFVELVDRHNEVRRLAGVPPLVWNDLLATVAQDYGDLCVWEHNSSRTAQYQALSGTTESVGENLAASTASPGEGYVPRDGFEPWADEFRYYDYDTTICAGGEVCGHYTQIVWADAREIGCALVTCEGIVGLPWTGASSLLVCNYITSQYSGHPYAPVSDPCVDLDRDGWLQQHDCDDIKRSVGLTPGCALPGPLPTDFDGDGVPAPADCHDGVSFIYPGANDWANGIDDNCNGVIDD